MASRVFLVDDDGDVRRALYRLLTSFGFDVRAFASARDFLDSVRPHEPACLIVDLRLPDGTGFDIQQAVLSGGEPLGIVFLSGHGDIPTSVRAMKAGASDFLTKPVDADELREAVSRALAWSAEQHARHREQAEFRRRLGTLTPRERQVCALVVEGLLNKQIGDRLGTTEKTVKVHRARVMDKLGVTSVAELARLAERTAALDADVAGTAG